VTQGSRLPGDVRLTLRVLRGGHGTTLPMHREGMGKQIEKLYCKYRKHSRPLIRLKLIKQHCGLMVGNPEIGTWTRSRHFGQVPLCGRP